MAPDESAIRHQRARFRGTKMDCIALASFYTHAPQGEIQLVQKLIGLSRMSRSWSRTYCEKISRRHDRDSFEAPHWQQVSTISRYDMSRAGNLGAFQDFVIIRVSDNRLEHLPESTPREETS